MPTIAITFTVGELFNAACENARELSERILKLADVAKTPLNPGESVDNRRHQIAKLGKLLAEQFIAIDNLVKSTAEDQAKTNDVTADAPTPAPDNPNSN
jgi:hypothetical protein